MPERKLVKLSELRPGPIRHDSLPDELLEVIKAVYDVVGPYMKMTLEQFEIGFMRDAHPEREVAVWCSITAAWIAYQEQYLNDESLPDDEEAKLVSALIAISMGVTEAEKLGVPVEVSRRLQECYSGA